MRTIIVKFGLVITAIWSSLIMGSLTGCASGGFHLTREWAGFVNKQNLIIRIILYILAGVIFVVTLLVDMVIFNTMDFWEGKVSAGSYNFNKDGRVYAVTHRYLDKGLRDSEITVSGIGLMVPQTIRLTETAKGEIQVFENGILKATVSDITNVPKLSMFNAKGTKTESFIIWPELKVAAR